MARGSHDQKAYRSALDLLIENEPARRLDIRLSYKNFLELEKYVIRYGRMELHGDNANLGLTVGDLFLSDEEGIDGIHSEPIYLKTRMVEEFLGDGAVETARSRSRFFHALGKQSH
ncbi:hypothetical protein V1520DRAFT_363946 [Lipomyces starkeyi]|uniref:Uncharacterized protein n=1 Tax=Lipomyces starkeyi NRRL Y-11557 TaxID=675824 RepID=A0A1E3PZ99_LIPST|nr:hypothetical protein LIPSTDRAFT_6318 [Lipomyces starkeyi NRRL Y-11557]